MPARMTCVCVCAGGRAQPPPLLAPPPAQVALVPGEAFGAPATVRLSYAATRAHIGDAVAKLAQFLGELN